MSEKQRLRELVWGRIDAAREVRRAPGAVGRIPNYVGAEAAAERITEMPEWKRARVLKMNPDSPQHTLRARAIDDGKLVYMAVPKLASDLPFVRLEKMCLTVPATDAASIEGAARHGMPVSLQAMEPIDLIVCGSVVVNAVGARIGKGGGYADLEYALLSELGRVTEATLIVSTVHDLQVLDEALPETEHDFRLDRIATPTRRFVCPPWPRPRGILWDDLDAAKIASIPALAARAHSTST